MTTNLALMPDFMDPINLLSYFGTWALIGLLVVVFVESGVLFPILPGDSLLFVANRLLESNDPDENALGRDLRDEVGQIRPRRGSEGAASPCARSPP